MTRPFHSPYSHGFVRAALCVPRVRVADPDYNLQRTLELARRASGEGALVALFPELGLSAYSNDDLFQQDALLDACEAAVARLASRSRDLGALAVVGAPLRVAGRLYNCALPIHRGRILGAVPKTYIPGYREFYEKRQFASGREAAVDTAAVAGQRVPFGRDLLFEASNLPGLCLHLEICEDVWAPVPPSSLAAMAGATLLLNLSASNVTIGKEAYRRTLCAAQSARCLAAYLYSAAGGGESTTDLAWDGHGMIYENGEALAETERFADDEQVVVADIDLDRLLQERARLTSFGDAAAAHGAELRALRRIRFEPAPPQGEMALRRPLERFPFVPHAAAERDERCYEAYNIQVSGLLKRLRSSGIRRLVVGVSGGLDSTQALIVAARTMDRLGRPRKDILAYTMPGFATSAATHANARELMAALGAGGGEIDIRPACMQMFRDIGHPFAGGTPLYDVTFENVQAGERTSHLFRLANIHDALVLGTGDLSELALGWTTYGVGDHMSHYNVNASLPKTLIQHLIRWVIDSGQFDARTHAVLREILNTEISPELVPAATQGSAGRSDRPHQSTESRIGPYELQDFHLYFVLRYGFRPSKVAYLAHCAWGDRARGGWPEGLPEAERREYDLAAIKRWLEVFLARFFQGSQFKRSCVPNGPKIGSGGSLSPRGDWRAPSDAEATVWLEELRRGVPDED